MTDIIAIPSGLAPGDLYIVGRRPFDRLDNGELREPGIVMMVYADRRLDQITAIQIPWEAAEQLASGRLIDAVQRFEDALFAKKIAKRAK